MHIWKAVENKMFPHFLATFQWGLLVLSLAFNLNISVAVTGAVAGGGLKVILLFHVWMLLFPVVLCLLFCRIRKEGTVEKIIIGFSLIAVLFSILNLSIHFVDNLILLMEATEVTAWSSYNCIFSLSIYKILTMFLFSAKSGFTKIEGGTVHSDKKPKG